MSLSDSVGVAEARQVEKVMLFTVKIEASSIETDRVMLPYVQNGELTIFISICKGEWECVKRTR